mmetsp:Transcript_312/g.428  ORF Transcript_312/g.428 Transcript_312/m.428 type:complete len:192 (+) Transcript_312:1121-1696(+)
MKLLISISIFYNNAIKRFVKNIQIIGFHHISFLLFLLLNCSGMMHVPINIQVFVDGLNALIFFKSALFLFLLMLVICTGLYFALICKIEKFVILILWDLPVLIIYGLLSDIFRTNTKTKKKVPMPDPSSWTLTPTTDNTPRQLNGYDCGVFTIFCAHYNSLDGIEPDFSQPHIPHLRKRIMLAIIDKHIPF